ncbi:hypothetical protein [Nesterenkonia rhizosphaerae]|uniref:Uncharacterized protein n=1 Tax=Nesterenkonia rhizosphaerae TaxID=1348272 RepID=A0ABP9G0E5_9MICC
MSSLFDPLAAAKQIIADTDITDPDKIAAEVLSRTPKHQIRAVYASLLRGVAKNAIGQLNMRTSTAHREELHATSPAATRRTPAKSSRVASIRSNHLSYFAQRVHAQGTWKMLGDCTRDDVLDLIAQRQAKADANLAKAAEFKDLHERMVAAGVTLAKELDTAEQAKAA